MAAKDSAFPLRRGSDASENDFFDIPDESWMAMTKRQLRHIRTWVILFALLVYFLWPKSIPLPPQPNPHIHYDEVDWTRYAYTTYATSETDLCNSLMVYANLQRFESKAERLLFYPDEWDLIVDDENDRISELLILAKDRYNVQMSPIKVESIKRPSERFADATWDTSSAKFNAFGVIQYDRVIHLDTDITLLMHMDELFFLPPTVVAMPRAYWTLPNSHALSSQIVVIEPSYKEFLGLQETTLRWCSPHKEYGLLTSEFRRKEHHKFLGPEKDWIPDKVMAESKFVQFSDDPLPKPWVMWPQGMLAQIQPTCDNKPGTSEESGCRDRELWKELYDHFRRQRKVRIPALCVCVRACVNWFIRC
ncbi:hypothetical protein N7533_011482 [Penicillium manginii]|uniref:uncharacterized protein n=1 Tax=Penicillium manginii TaxID=203109 RepID=UPI0025486C2F|nr:uncharacterized protein N7533_011482 [Penicillium manginii]KAJ5742073.1 hypothetical protein N7533_011482 [Penicillium manginii]